MPETRTLKCFRCREEFDTEHSDEEALAEATANGFDINKPMIIVCDDCGNKLLKKSKELH